MGLTVHTELSAEIKELTKRFHCFSFLESSTLSKTNENRWFMTNSNFNYFDQEVYVLRAMFIGKTGYGKSTTLNKIVGKNVFDTSDVNVCTKDLYEAIFRMSDSNFFALSDLPGIGESNYADNRYYEWYRDMLKKSHCVVYILRADQRDFAVDEILFKQMFCSENEKEKVILALNFADKIEPINRTLGLSEEQISNLNKKIIEVSNIFHMPKSKIIYYSANDEINIDSLMLKVSEILKKSSIIKR